MSQDELEKDLRFFMNAMTAQNLILRALLRNNPSANSELRLFLDKVNPENDDQKVVYEEVRKILPNL